MERRFVANSISVSLGRDFPIRVGGLFAPKFDYQGSRCFDLSNYDEPAYHISVSTHTSNDDVVGVFTWFIDSPEIDRFISSFSAIRNDHKRSAFAQTCFEIFEHIYFPPAWWASLPEAMIEKITKRFVDGVPGERAQNSLMRDALYDRI